jgi:hypothetical protein
VEGPLATANQEIREAERQAVQQRIARLTAPQHLIDRLLHQLEELNLDDMETVPERYAPVLADLRGQLSRQAEVSPRLLRRLQTGARTTELIETIFSIQEVIAPPTLAPGELPFDEVM